MAVQAGIRYGAVQVFDNVLPAGLYRDLINATRRVGWQFGWNTCENPNHRYWHHEIGLGGKNNVNDITANVRRHPIGAFAGYVDWIRSELLPPETSLLRLYMNAHTYGTDGFPHVDTDRPGELTAVLYLAPEWKPEWGGETVIFDEQGDISAAVLPRSNRLLTFPSHRLHSPRPLSKIFDSLRVVLVAKLAPPEGCGEQFFERRRGPEVMRIAPVSDKKSTDD